MAKKQFMQMNKSIYDYFSDNNSGKEQWDNAITLAKSVHAGLRHILTRVAGYNALLELELEENPTGKIYVEESNKSLRKSMVVLDYLDKFSKIGSDSLESIDLKIVIDAVAKRLNSIGQFNIEINDRRANGEENFIQGNLFLLQQLFFDLPHVISHGDSELPKTLYLQIESMKYDDNFFKKRKSVLSSGDFIKITIDSKKQESNSEDFSVIFEKLNINPGSSFSDRLFFLYGAVLAHGGDLFLSKDNTNLSTFYLLFPMKRNRISMYSDKNLKKNELKGSETILLVDDEDIIWDVVIDMLQNMGYTVILASNGRECVEIYESNPGEIDLVLLDMVMPELNGHEAFFELKKIDPEVRVLLSSGYVEEEDARDVLNSGAAGFLEKPYRMLDLAQKIRQILNL